jgi:hypothetical protein
MPSAQTYPSPPALGGAIATVPVTTPYPEVKTVWTAYANAVGYTWSASQPLTAAQCGSANPCTVSWSTAISAGYAGSQPSFQMPNLSQLAGWSASFQFVPGTTVSGEVFAQTSSAGESDFPPALPALGGTNRRFASSSYSVTP